MPIRESDVTKLPKGCKTFELWKQYGYSIKRGQKAVGYLNGKAVFSPAQVEPTKFGYIGQEDYNDEDYEDYGPEWVFGPND